jgi:hypothetical protein
MLDMRSVLLAIRNGGAQDPAGAGGWFEKDRAASWGRVASAVRRVSGAGLEHLAAELLEIRLTSDNILLAVAVRSNWAGSATRSAAPGVVPARLDRPVVDRN